MARRLINGDKLRGPWYTALSSDARLLYMTLLLDCENWGLVPAVNESILAITTGLDAERLSGAFDALEQAGELVGEGGAAWLPRMIDLCNYNATWILGAINDAAKVGGVLGKLCEDRYRYLLASIDTYHQRKEQDATPAKSGRKRAAEKQEHVDAAAEFDKYIRERIEHYNVPHGVLNNDPQESARAIRFLVKDGITVEDMRSTLHWAWGRTWVDQQSGKEVRYGTFLLSIPRWAEGQPGSRKFARAWQQWKALDAPQQGMGRAERQRREQDWQRMMEAESGQERERQMQVLQRRGEA